MVAGRERQTGFDVGKTAMDANTTVVNAIRGVRQGCSLGAIISNITYECALAAVRTTAAEENLTYELHWDPDTPPWASRHQPHPQNIGPNATRVHEATYVDDNVFFICDETAEGTLQKARCLLSIVGQEFGKAGFQLNTDPGKTEAILSLRGPSSRRLWRQLREQGLPRLHGMDGNPPVLPPFLGSDARLRAKGPGRASTGRTAVSCGIVDSYRHLGSIKNENGSPLQDSKARANAMFITYTQLAHRVFC